MWDFLQFISPKSLTLTLQLYTAQKRNASQFLGKSIKSLKLSFLRISFHLPMRNICIGPKSLIDSISMPKTPAL